MKNNIERLKEETDIAAVVDYLQIPVTRKGSAYFILCPAPGHEDTHPTNCYFKTGWNNVYCEACGTSFQAVDLIMFTLKCSYGEAADTLWEINGRPDWYYSKREPSRKEAFVIKADELKTVGIRNPGVMLCPCNVSSRKEPCGKGKRYLSSGSGDEYVLADVRYMRWNDFLSEQEYRELVRRKAQERLEQLKEMDSFLRCIADALNRLGIQEVPDGLLSEDEKIVEEIISRTKKAIG